MKFVGGMLRNRYFILSLALALGLIAGKPLATLTAPSVLPFLAVVMTLSAIDIISRELTSLKNVPYSAGLTLLLTYVVLGGITLLLAWWLIEDSNFWIEFVVIAVVPPAVGVVPFSYILVQKTMI